VVTSALPAIIDDLWAQADTVSPDDPEVRRAITDAIELLDQGSARVAHLGDDGEVQVDERAKKAILLALRFLPIRPHHGEDGRLEHADRIPLKTRMDGVRVVPGALARWGSHIEPGAVLMPSFTNIGAYIGTGTMIDTWATVGSCAQVGCNVHLAGGAGLGGVLEPAQAAPVIVEDDVFIGSRAIVVEGARVRQGAKLGAGVILTASTRVFDATTGAELPRGEVPARAVAVGSTRIRSFPGGEFGMPCLLILRYLEPGQEHDKLALNDALRAHGITT
jgi:2,3,4,5-tetrahydropyridine-2,6-dicarboxylate N-succinyltransferase